MRKLSTVASILNNITALTDFVNALGTVLLPLAYLAAASLALVLLVLLAPVIKGLALLVGLTCHVIERLGYSLLSKALPVGKVQPAQKLVPEEGVELCGIRVQKGHLCSHSALLRSRWLRHKH